MTALSQTRHLHWDPKNCPDYRGVLIPQVHLSPRLYCNGTTTDCPYCIGVLISECPQ